MVSKAQLVYAPKSAFDAVLDLESSLDRTRAFAALARLNTLYTIKKAGSGHIGSSFSSLELVSWIHLHALRRHDDPAQGFRDYYFSSKGHDAPALYSVLIGLGLLDFDKLHQLRRLGGLPGHPDVGTPHITTNTGSLGMGISKARGLLYASRLAGEDRRAYVLTGDGELQEGQFWESLQPTANYGYGGLTVIVDHNKLQSDTWVEKVSDLGQLEKRLESHGWRVSRVDGHQLGAIERALDGAPGDRPHIVIADTIKGYGVSFMESRAFDKDALFYDYHSGAPSNDEYVSAVDELRETVERRFRRLGLTEPRLESMPLPDAASPSRSSQRLVAAYGKALVERATHERKLVALDADLVLDTGLTEFRERFPDRFVECGIAEQDMVSQAGGMALAGLIPVVHSFSCFLSARPNEQIYNNATEHTKIIYVGSLAGLVPGGPGHSHQCVRDISALKAVPNLIMIEPASEKQVADAVDFCVKGTEASSYLRLVSIPCEIPFTDGPEPLEVGRGSAIRDGADAVIIGYGPVLLTEAWHAAASLSEMGIEVRIVNLPWLNRVDRVWLAREISAYPHVITLDNHYLAGGQGEMIACAIAELEVQQKTNVLRLGLYEIPACGTNEEVLAHHELDRTHITAQVLEQLRS